MPETLLEGGKAAALYLYKLGFSRVQQYETETQVCANGTYNGQKYIIFTGWNGSEPGASFIGTDGADIGYFHLGAIGTSWQKIYNNTSCNADGYPALMGWLSLGVTVHVTDGGSDTAPYDGHVIVPHSGYIVCAARRRGPGQSAWVPFSAGDATALTVAAARAACDVNDFYGDLGGAPEPFNLVIRSIPVD